MKTAAPATRQPPTAAAQPAITRTKPTRLLLMGAGDQVVAPAVGLRPMPAGTSRRSAPTRRRRQAPAQPAPTGCPPLAPLRCGALAAISFAATAAALIAREVSSQSAHRRDIASSIGGRSGLLCRGSNLVQGACHDRSIRAPTDHRRNPPRDLRRPLSRGYRRVSRSLRQAATRSTPAAPPGLRSACCRATWSMSPASRRS